MMIMNSREEDNRAKRELGEDTTKISKSSATTPSSSRQWAAGFRNPRIVRVSRSFGGKDRHSKVCTVRGLRDRRIRLSVPTAIQLYDLQDRLGLSQPSKVVDWLLDNTKNEIDKLPPLQMPPGNNFTQLFLHQHHDAPAPHHHLLPNNPHFFDANHPASVFMKDGSRSSGIMKMNDPEMSQTSQRVSVEKEKWIAASDQEGGTNYASHLTAQNFFPLMSANQSSFPNLLSNASLQYNPYYHLDAPPNLSLSQFGGSAAHNAYPSQAEGEDSHNINNYSMPMASHQLYFCPTAAAIPTIIPPLPAPPYNLPPPAENNVDPTRQISHFQLLGSPSSQANSLMPTLHFISSPMKSLTLNVNPKMILHSQQNPSNKGGNSS